MLSVGNLSGLALEKLEEIVLKNESTNNDDDEKSVVGPGDVIKSRLCWVCGVKVTVDTEVL